MSSLSKTGDIQEDTLRWAGPPNTNTLSACLLEKLRQSHFQV